MLNWLTYSCAFWCKSPSLFVKKNYKIKMCLYLRITEEIVRLRRSAVAKKSAYM